MRFAMQFFGSTTGSKMNYLDLLEEFWKEAFQAGKRSRIIRDGHYHPPTDLDVLRMYLMGGEL